MKMFFLLNHMIPCIRVFILYLLYSYSKFILLLSVLFTGYPVVERFKLNFELDVIFSWQII